MNVPTTRIHIAPYTEGKQVLSFITFGQGKNEGGDVLFGTLPKGFAYTTFTFESGPEEADYILIPHPLRAMNPETIEYVETMRSYAKKFGKPLIAFPSGDYHHAIFFEGIILLKGSQYGYLFKNNEILIPCFIEDLSEKIPIVIRPKSEKPTISFCGYASFSTPALFLKYVIRNMLIDIAATVSCKPHLRLHKRGLYWRRRSMRLLNKDSRIRTNFIARKSFSASAELVSINPAQVRKEYLENMRDCDFALTPKGDANISLRFYEALSMGRIPLLIDTDVVLPFEALINYDEFVLRIPYAQLNNIGDLVMEFYASLSDDQFRDMQVRAREAYEKWLRFDSFFNSLFADSTILKSATDEAMAKTP